MVKNLAFLVTIPFFKIINPNYLEILFILLVFGIPLGAAFIYCLLQMRPKEAKMRRKRRRRKKPIEPSEPIESTEPVEPTE